MLIATKETQRIDKWINIKTGALDYDVRIVEVSSFGNPDEVEILQHQALQFQTKTAHGSPDTRLFSPNMVIEEDDDVALEKENLANGNKVVGGKHVQSVGARADRIRYGGSKRVLTKGHLMQEGTSNWDCSGGIESIVGDSLEGLVKKGPDLDLPAQSNCVADQDSLAHIRNAALGDYHDKSLG